MRVPPSQDLDHGRKSQSKLGIPIVKGVQPEVVREICVVIRWIAFNPNP